MKSLLIAAALLTAAAPLPMLAEPLQVTLTGVDGGGVPEYGSFLIDREPTILPNNYSIGEGFRVKYRGGIFHYGTDDTYLSYLQDVEFQSADAGGGFFTLFPTDKTGQAGFILIVYSDINEQLYTGPESSPSIRTGEFTVYDGFDGSPLSLSIVPVPEPSTWAGMTIGVLMLGSVLRRRRAAAAGALSARA